MEGYVVLCQEDQQRQMYLERYVLLVICYYKVDLQREMYREGYVVLCQED